MKQLSRAEVLALTGGVRIDAPTPGFGFSFAGKDPGPVEDRSPVWLELEDLANRHMDETAGAVCYLVAEHGDVARLADGRKVLMYRMSAFVRTGKKCSVIRFPALSYGSVVDDGKIVGFICRPEHEMEYARTLIQVERASAEARKEIRQDFKGHYAVMRSKAFPQNLDDLTPRVRESLISGSLAIILHGAEGSRLSVDIVRRDRAEIQAIRMPFTAIWVKDDILDLARADAQTLEDHWVEQGQPRFSLTID